MAETTYATLFLALQRCRGRHGQPQTVQVCAACQAALARFVATLDPVETSPPPLRAGMTMSVGPNADCALKEHHG